MDCPSCGYRNDEGARFCGECGGTLSVGVRCPACGVADSGGHRFCTACGQALSGGARLISSGEGFPAGPAEHEPELRPLPHAAERIVGARAQLEGERKQVTVVFVDIVRSMELERALGAERWRKALDVFLRIAADTVHRFQGTVEKFTGDGIMAIFGAPVGQEDHARCACLTALAIQEELQPLACSLGEEGIAFAMRIGLNSGEVIVGEIGVGGAMTYTAIGPTVGLAQRMESVAPPGSTVLSAGTAALVSTEFELNALGEFELKGADAPEPVFELVAKAASGDRVRTEGALGILSPFVGRASEQATLRAAFDRAAVADGRVVGLVGEPGVGKSRLAYELLEACRERRVGVHRARALAHARQVPFVPVLELLRSLLGVGERDDGPQGRARIEACLETLDSSFEEDLPLIFEFLGVADPERHSARMGPDVRQRRLLSFVRRMIQSGSRAAPAVILIEDLHWIDDASAVFLEEIVRATAGTRTLLILTYRPEYAAEILGHAHCERIALSPLGPSAVAELLENLLGPDRSLDGLAELIGDRAAGNPFFCEELVAALAESGHLKGERGTYRLGRTLGEIVLPATVQATLAARIDRLGEREKDLLQVASVIGLDVSPQLLGAVSTLADPELSRALRALVSGGLLIERADQARIEYAFRHPLTQEVVYRSQLGDRRRQVHREVALAIERLDAEKLDELAALVAQHWEAAGEMLAAARFAARAAVWVGLRDVAQSLSHWRKLHELLANAPESAEKATLSLVGHVGQLDYGWRVGISEQEAAAHYRAGRQLAEQSDNPLGLLLVLGPYSQVHNVSGNVREGSALTEELYRLGRATGDPGIRLRTITGPIYSGFVTGRLGEALDLAEQGVALGAEDHKLGLGGVIFCPYAWCLTMKGVLLYFTGRLEEAALELEHALIVAEQQGDVEVQIWAHMFCIPLARYSGQVDTVRAHATRSREIAERFGYAYSRVWSLFGLGYAELMLGDAECAVEHFERSVALAREAHTVLDLESWLLAGLAEALLGAGDRTRALATVEESITLARQRGNEAILAISYRVLADVVLSSENPERMPRAQDALDKATAAVGASGAYAELRFIDRARETLASVSAEQR